jgi:isochorismate hydrolase
MKKDVYGPRPAEWMAALGPFMNEHRARRHVFSPEHSALLVMDMQRYFLDESSHAYLPAAAGIKANVSGIVAGFRALSLPIIFTRHALLRDEEPGAMGRWWGDVLHDDDELSNIDTDMLPMPNDTVVRKTQYNAFLGTDLDKMLWRMGVSRVVVTGVKTHLCCESTARDAFMRGYDVFFVIDGTASNSEELHLASLKNLTDGFATPVTTEEVLSWLRK